MAKLFKLLYRFFVVLFYICTFGFGIMAIISLIYVCYRNFDKALTFANYSALLLIGSIIFVLLGMAIDVEKTKYKIWRW